MRAGPRTLAAAGVACLLCAQLVGGWAWGHRPVVQGRATVAAEGSSVREMFVDLEPGEFAGTLLLGGFRGLVIDVLWLRAVTAKERGRYYESVALFEMISKAQPRFEIVWNYMAWDMAYNIAYEVDDRHGKWLWFLAGIEANAKGARRNPQSERILRHLSWMFFHKGENFTERVEAHDWERVLGPILERYGRGDFLDEPRDPFAIAATLYRCTVELAMERGPESPYFKQPSFVQRLIPIAIEKSGNHRRNRGEHLAALRTYLESIDAWQWVLANTGREELKMSELQKRFHRDSYRRNEGRMRRRAAHLAGLLAPDETVAAAAAAAIVDRETDRVRAMIEAGGWKTKAGYGLGVRWYDDGEP